MSGAIQRSSIQEPGQGQVTGAEYKNWHTSRRQEQKQELATGAVTQLCIVAGIGAVYMIHGMSY